MRDPATSSFSMVLVEDRAWTRHVAALDLWCDDREVLANLPDTYRQWLAGVYMRTHPKPANDDELVETSGRTTLAIGDGRLVGIISPDSARELAVWFSIALDDLLNVQVIERNLTGRPTMIRVRVSGWSLAVARVSQYDGRLGPGARDGRERSLMKALGGAAPWRALRAVGGRHGRQTDKPRS